MTERIQKKNDHLSGVKCVVNSCHFHAQGDYCNAAKIEIQPKNASDTQETDCATFMPEQS